MGQSPTGPKTVTRDGKDYPVLPIATVEQNPSYGDAVILVTDDCPYCGESHRHGTGKEQVEVGWMAHRVEHCGGHEHSRTLDTDGGGYFIELTEETEIRASL